MNVDASAGSVAVELLHATGAPIKGFSGDDSVQYRNVDQLRLQPHWKEEESLSSLEGRLVRLKFRLRKATLYSFQITKGPG